MQTYQSTPDFYRDYIEHGWLKDAASKAHKYIDRWRGKNGKWYYRYKSKAEELSAKARRKKAGIINPAEISRTADYGTKHARVMRVGPNEIDNGRGFKRSPGLRNTYDRNWTWTFNKTKTTKVNLPKKKGNLSSRGYSSSQGSGESKRQRNLGTRKVAGSNRIGTTIRIKDPNYKPKFESLSGSGKDGYQFNEPGWYWRERSLKGLSKRQDRNGYKVETYTVSNGKKKKKK